MYRKKVKIGDIRLEEYKAPFDRKIFDPINNEDDRATLERLRNFGFGRSCALRVRLETDFKDSPHNKFYKIRSSAYEAIHWKNVKNGTFIDLGCGHSADAKIASLEGFKNVYALDLCDVNCTWDRVHLFRNTKLDAHILKNPVKFIKQDMVEKISLKANSVDMAICQAVVDLIEPKGRTKFYKNVYRIMKKGGYFSCYIMGLAAGHGFNLPEERDECLKIGFKLYSNYQGGFILQKV